jgi:uncharacterized protein (DUF488 family)
MAVTKAYSIGFTRKDAAEFFGILRQHKIRRLIDVRLNNTSQLAGFTKKKDLAYFLHEILNAEYEHSLMLAPTPELLSAYRTRRIDWQEYERRFLTLMKERRVEELVNRHLFDVPTVLLCTEPKADRCHRRLVLEYLQKKWNDLQVVHL